MISSSKRHASVMWTPDLAERCPPGTVIVEPHLGIQGQKRVVSDFDVTSAEGPCFRFSIWSKNGEVLIPATAESDKDAEIGCNQSLPITTIPPLDIDYGKPHYDMMRSWLETCRNHHESCKTSAAWVVNENKQTILPTRLIDIDRIEEDIVTLVDTKGARGNYCALSYCWGLEPDKHIKTTKTTLSDHRNGIKIENLPQVFKDAIRVTHEIGLRYLWADSLCIIQGDDKDWKAEAGRMSEVYRNADLVIAAAGASNPSQGCFVQRDMAPFPEMQVSNVPITDNPEEARSIWIQQAMTHWTEPSMGPLQKRGWTLQETYLARRSIHFMPSGMHWQCEELQTNERTFGNPILERERWLSLLTTFSRRQVTRMEDRLYAIQGLVNEFQEDLGPYQKGVFTNLIPEQILWSIQKTYDDEDASEVEIWEGAPSWSWAHKSGSKWFWFRRGCFECSLQANKSPVGLTLNDDDVLRFTGYSASCQVADCVDGDTRTDDYEAAVLETARGWARKLYTMTQLGGATAQTVGFVTLDKPPLSNVTILFIAERTWDSVQQERVNE
ncbi:hypothetical protein NM208_g9152 [Fusarium decemcellulare]|uniref:Uncharacterized protein n=2 Tax=Fusarium decemcellulare TaxID=57161 RepID=A0ACC1S2M6_9HYPO|nr:hypothetical protein NM208_g11741 [Fusarium decemcellulare]KAJ3530825.1 hypothetical protein NM208_g9152 [Fusarium decemcellulare]